MKDLTAERDAALKERYAFEAEVDRLSKLVGKTSTPPTGGGGGKPTGKPRTRRKSIIRPQPT